MEDFNIPVLQKYVSSRPFRHSVHRVLCRTYNLTWNPCAGYHARMLLSRFGKNSAVTALFLGSAMLFAHISAVMGDEADVNAVEKAAIDSTGKQAQLAVIATLLTEYENEGRKLLAELEGRVDRDAVDERATRLLSSGEKIMTWARFRLAQCDEYLEKSLELKAKLPTISRAVLERDYHHDGILPKAPAECYHVKDTFVHPATALLLTRDDPALGPATIKDIRAEMMEVLSHTEVVRQLIIY